MNYEVLTQQIARADAYAPELELPVDTTESHAAFSEIQRRISMESQQTRGKSVDGERPTPNRWGSGVLVAAAAFAGVIAVVAAVWLLGPTSAEDNAPVTTPTVEQSVPSTTEATTTTSETTTTAAPDADPQALALVSEWANALNEGDHDAASDLVLAARTWDGPGGTDEERRLFFEIWTVMESDVVVGDCRALSSGPTRCSIERFSEMEPFYPEPETSYIEVRFDDAGDLAFARTMPIQTDPWWIVWDEFWNWTSDTYGSGPDSPYIQLFVALPDTAEEWLQIYREQTAIWKAERDG